MENRRKQINQRQYKKWLQLLKKDAVDLKTNPYQLIKQDQQRARTTGNQRTNMPYNWVRQTISQDSVCFKNEENSNQSNNNSNRFGQYSNSYANSNNNSVSNINRRNEPTTRTQNSNNISNSNSNSNSSSNSNRNSFSLQSWLSNPNSKPQTTTNHSQPSYNHTTNSNSTKFPQNPPNYHHHPQQKSYKAPIDNLKIIQQLFADEQQSLNYSKSNENKNNDHEFRFNNKKESQERYNNNSNKYQARNNDNNGSLFNSNFNSNNYNYEEKRENNFDFSRNNNYNNSSVRSYNSNNNNFGYSSSNNGSFNQNNNIKRTNSYNNESFQEQRFGNNGNQNQFNQNKPMTSSVRPRDIFKDNKKEKALNNNQNLCGLKEVDKKLNLTSVKIFQTKKSDIKNYQQGDSKYWENDAKYTDHQLRLALRNFSHVKDFKNNQKAIIKCALNGNDVFTCIPTGGGKSLIFQLMTFIQKGVYLCILPLISLIYDQQMQAQQFNIQAYSLTGATPAKEQRQIYSKIQNYQHGDNSILIFCTPQKISLSQNFMEILSEIYNSGYLKHVIIDEVHCVSTWGKQFRKQYENLSQVKVFFPKTPILALTATVTQLVKQEIIQRLKLCKCIFFQSNFNRPNLFYQVRQKVKRNAFQEINSILQSHKNEAGIIYCLSRRQCEQMCSVLNKAGYKTAFYHANLGDKQKREIQASWMKDKIRIIVATIAFGMGINKPDVRFVIHHSLSQSLQNYYQQSGRAGRDGLPSKCILLYTRKDMEVLQSMNQNNTYSSQANKLFINSKLLQMVRYCEQKFTCRRKLQLDYLGQKDFDPKQCSKTCDNCINDKKFKAYECITHAKQIIKFVLYVTQKKQRVTRKQLIQFVRNKGGKKPNKGAKNFNYPGNATLHQMFKYWSVDQLEDLLLQLLVQQIFIQKGITYTVPKIGNVTNMYVQSNKLRSKTFLQRVQTFPIRRQFRISQNSRPSFPLTTQQIQQLFSDEEQYNFKSSLSDYEVTQEQKMGSYNQYSKLCKVKQDISQLKKSYQTNFKEKNSKLKSNSSFQGSIGSLSYDSNDEYENINFDDYSYGNQDNQFVPYDSQYEQRMNEINMQNGNKQLQTIVQIQDSQVVKLKSSTKSDQLKAQTYDFITSLFQDQTQI